MHGTKNIKLQIIEKLILCTLVEKPYVLVILSSTPSSIKWSLPFRFSNQIMKLSTKFTAATPLLLAPS